jgi:hypothetical protein
MPRCKSPLLPLPSLLPGANNEPSLREHDSITLNFVTPEERNIRTDGISSRTGVDDSHEQKSSDKDKGDGDLPKVSIKGVSF